MLSRYGFRFEENNSFDWGGIGSYNPSSQYNILTQPFDLVLAGYIGIGEDIQTLIGMNLHAYIRSSFAATTITTYNMYSSINIIKYATLDYGLFGLSLRLPAVL